MYVFSRDNIEYHNLTGLTCDHFGKLLTYVSVNSSINRPPRPPLGIFIMRLRTGLSHQVLATLFWICSSTGITKLTASICNNLGTAFGPASPGPNLSNNILQSLLQHCLQKMTEIVMFSFLMELTCVYRKKTVITVFSRRSFSVHNRRPLVNPFATTPEYKVSVLGPYLVDGKKIFIIKHIV